MRAKLGKNGVQVAAVAVLALAATTDGLAAPDRVSTQGAVTILTVSNTGQSSESLDGATVYAMPLPSPAAPAPGILDGDIAPRSTGTPGFSPGAPGTGQTQPTSLGALTIIDADPGMGPQEYGTANHPYSTVRVDFAKNTESKTYPNSAAGQLFFNIGTAKYMCSASLIKRGVIVTAAHCVAAFGQNQFYTNWEFTPARSGTLAPYQKWKGLNAIVMTSYFNGTDTCYSGAPGVVCQNDVAVIILKPANGAYPGTKTGWLGYGWDGFGFTPDNLALITQLGYPASHDKGEQMQRTDSQGFVSATYVNNTVWGGRQTGGSSGGPETVNLGVRPVLDASAPVGSEAENNIVVGVTSWGYTSSAIKQQGASPFTSSNIVPLVAAACSATPAACN